MYIADLKEDHMSIVIQRPFFLSIDSTYSSANDCIIFHMLQRKPRLSAVKKHPPDVSVGRGAANHLPIQILLARPG